MMSSTTTGLQEFGQWVTLAAASVRTSPRGAWAIFLVTLIHKAAVLAYRNIMAAVSSDRGYWDFPAR